MTERHLSEAELVAYNTPENRAFLTHFKEVLKDRFAKAEIYITAQEIEII